MWAAKHIYCKTSTILTNISFIKIFLSTHEKAALNALHLQLHASTEFYFWLFHSSSINSLNQRNVQLWRHVGYEYSVISKIYYMCDTTVYWSINLFAGKEYIIRFNSFKTLSYSENYPIPKAFLMVDTD